MDLTELQITRSRRLVKVGPPLLFLVAFQEDRAVNQTEPRGTVWSLVTDGLTGGKDTAGGRGKGRDRPRRPGEKTDQ